MIISFSEFCAPLAIFRLILVEKLLSVNYVKTIHRTLGKSVSWVRPLVESFKCPCGLNWLLIYHYLPRLKVLYPKHLITVN